MQKFIAIGRLGRDPEGKTIAYGENQEKTIDKVEFSMAVDSGYGKNRKTSWLMCEAFGKVGQNIARYIHKGDVMGISGYIQVNQFDNKQGQKVTMTKIIVEEAHFLPKQSATKNINPEDEYIPETPVNVEIPKEPDEEGFMDVPDNVIEDLPFR